MGLPALRLSQSDRSRRLRQTLAHTYIYGSTFKIFQKIVKNFKTTKHGAPGSCLPEPIRDTFAPADFRAARGSSLRDIRGGGIDWLPSNL